MPKRWFCRGSRNSGRPVLPTLYPLSLNESLSCRGQKMQDFLFSMVFLLLCLYKRSRFLWIEILSKCINSEAQIAPCLFQMATWCEKLTHLKRPWCWGRLKAEGEGDNRGWDGWMASLTQWTWVWVSSGSWWWTGRPGVLQSMGSQGVRHECLNRTELSISVLLYYVYIYIVRESPFHDWLLWYFPHKFAIGTECKNFCEPPMTMSVI